MSTRTPRSKRVLRVLLATATLAVAGPSLVPEVVVATSVDEARRRVEQIVDELDRLAERSDKLTEDYAEAVDRKNGLDVEVAAAEQRVAEMGAELDRLRDDLAAVAVRSFTGAGNDVLGPLFTNATIYNDTLQRDQYSRVALSVGTTTADDFDALLVEYEAEQAALERKRAEVEDLTAQISTSLTEADELRTEYQQRRAQAEAELGAAIAAEEQRRAEESYRRMQAEAAAAQTAQAQAASQQAASSGGNAPASGGNAPASGGDAAPASGGDAPASGGDGGSTNAAPTPPPAPAPAQYPQPSSLAQVAVNAAMGQQGVPYRYATSLPGESFDCSGLTHYAWAQAGVYLPRNSRAQFASTPRVPNSEARPGDLIYYYSPISHVGLYIGGGQMVHAPNTGSVVHARAVNWSKVVGVTRPG